MSTLDELSLSRLRSLLLWKYFEFAILARRFIQRWPRRAEFATIMECENPVET